MKTASKAKAPATKKAVNAKASHKRHPAMQKALDLVASKPASKAKPAAATKAPAKAAKPASKPAKQASKPAKETTAQRHQRIATEVIGKPPAKAPKKALGKGIKELVEAPKAAAPAVIPEVVAAPATPRKTGEAIPPKPEVVPVEAPAPAPVKPSYVSKTGPDSKYHNPDRSTVKGPVAIMRQLCEENWPTGKMTRKQIIEAGMALGVTKNTAMTQFAMWKARYIADEEAAAD
jgi:DnaK suppressor protein